LGLGFHAVRVALRIRLVTALTKSTEVIAHKSAVIEQIHRKLMA
jgi:hypothetical protein